MYDSVTPGAIPRNAEMVGFYVDGEYQWSEKDILSFPESTVMVGIATQPHTNAGAVLDCEQGDATPEDCPPWIRMRQQAGYAVPSIYCAVSAMAAVQAACAGLTYDIWAADWTGAPHPVVGAVAVQYADPATSGGNYDLSAVYVDTWPVASSEELGMDLAEAQLEVWQWYTNYCGRVGSMDEVNGWATQLVAPGASYLGIITAFYSTPEAVAWRTAHP
jgi:hypothetical protein